VHPASVIIIPSHSNSTGDPNIPTPYALAYLGSALIAWVVASIVIARRDKDCLIGEAVSMGLCLAMFWPLTIVAALIWAVVRAALPNRR